ncbi:IS3 family transposase [Gemmatimonas sp.]|uniref:IS3 family transposase n=1 Tax=Gemmatimonas sp. TaxID=1962908 RepID=UPI0037C1554F
MRDTMEVDLVTSAPRMAREARPPAAGLIFHHAVAESCFATLDFELVMTHDWHTRGHARRAIFRYIETWYNRKRRHSTLGDVSPAEYEAQLPKAA